MSERSNPLRERERNISMECPADTCPEQGQPVQVVHHYSTGKWWPPDPWPTCRCGADLAYETP